jgi:hypothetical protein
MFNVLFPVDKFYVDPSTGVIKTTIPFDRETKDLYKFKVLAVDGGHSKAFTEFWKVVIFIKNLDDET